MEMEMALKYIPGWSQAPPSMSTTYRACLQRFPLLNYDVWSLWLWSLSSAVLHIQKELLPGQYFTTMPGEDTIFILTVNSITAYSWILLHNKLISEDNVCFRRIRMLEMWPRLMTTPLESNIFDETMRSCFGVEKIREIVRAWECEESRLLD